MSLRFTNTIYVGKAVPSSSGGGQSYTAGDGIVISSGGISLASDALASVPQSLPSGGKIVQQGSDGGYISMGSTGNVTIGTNGGYRFSCTTGTVAVKTQNNTGLFAADNGVAIRTNGAIRFNISGYNTYIYGTTTAGAVRVFGSGSTGYVRVKSNDGNYEDIMTESSYATSSAPGIVQPDNSTCTVDSGGILSITPPTTLWTSGNAGSEIMYSALDGASVLRAYKNGLLMESGADYVIGSSGVVSYTTPLESSDKAAFEYYPAAPTRNIVPDGGKALKSAEPPEDYIIDEEEENKGEER